MIENPIRAPPYQENEMTRRARTLVQLLLGPTAVAFVFGCASPYPVVLTTTAEQVAIEYEIDGSLTDASTLAEQECAKFGKKASYESVDATATPSTRIARYHCVSDAPAPVAAPPAAAAPETTAPAPTAAP